MRILITSGGTKVPVDRVRDITNMSNGTFGSKIAREALIQGHDVTFLCAKRSKTPFSVTLDYSNEGHWEQDLNAWADHWNFCEQHRSQYTETRFRNFDDYSQWLQHCVQMGRPDVVVLAAAVSDYGVANFVNGKVRSGSDTTIELSPLPKLIGQIKQWHPECLLVGFKLLMNSNDEELIEAAFDSINKNSCEMVIANDLRDIKDDNHRLLIVHGDEEVRTFRKNDSPDPNYLAKVVMEEIGKCQAKFSSGSQVA